MINWRLFMSLSGSTHYLEYEAEYKGRRMVLEIATSRRGHGESRLYYSFGGDDREFSTEDDLLDAIDALTNNTVCMSCGQRIPVRKKAEVR